MNRKHLNSYVARALLCAVCLCVTQLPRTALGAKAGLLCELEVTPVDLGAITPSTNIESAATSVMIDAEVICSGGDASQNVPITITADERALTRNGQNSLIFFNKLGDGGEVVASRVIVKNAPLAVPLGKFGYGRLRVRMQLLLNVQDILGASPGTYINRTEFRLTY